MALAPVGLDEVVLLHLLLSHRYSLQRYKGVDRVIFLVVDRFLFYDQKLYTIKQ